MVPVPCRRPAFLEQLGCEVTVLGGTADGQFEHTPEPLAENLTGLCDAVRGAGADAGFAQDPDADRLAIVDNNGRYIGEELTLALAADYVLARRQGARCRQRIDESREPPTSLPNTAASFTGAMSERRT